VTTWQTQIRACSRADEATARRCIAGRHSISSGSLSGAVGRAAMVYSRSTGPARALQACGQRGELARHTRLPGLLLPTGSLACCWRGAAAEMSTDSATLLTWRRDVQRSDLAVHEEALSPASAPVHYPALVLAIALFPAVLRAVVRKGLFAGPTRFSTNLCG